MESNPVYGLVGGITRVVLHPTKTPLAESSGDEVSLYYQGSSYSEEQSCESGQLIVTHRLTLVTHIGEDPLTGSKMRDAERDGIVADVTLSSGCKITLGWSEKHGFAAPLRLVTVETTSGEKSLDYPLKKWVWESEDSLSLI